MINVPKHILRFIILVFLQVIILNNVQLNGYLNPYMYVLFILLLPFEIPNWMLLLVAFVLGISIDVFSSTVGMHASACVFMAFLRPYVLNLIALRDGYEVGTTPGIACFGVAWFLKYSLILITAHHLFLFYIEMFSFANFGETFGRAILSVIFSFILIIISQFFMFKK